MVRHSSEWIRPLGDGTEESHRAPVAIDDLWASPARCFTSTTAERALIDSGIAVDSRDPASAMVQRRFPVS